MIAILFSKEAFSNFPMAFVKATVMTIGELEYSAMLVDSLYQTNQKSQAPLVPYPEFSFAFFFLFMIAMPIVLVNLLVSVPFIQLSSSFMCVCALTPPEEEKNKSLEILIKRKVGWWWEILVVEGGVACS